MNDLMLRFVDWYLEDQEGKEKNYCKDFCKSDREIFITLLSEYAVEFAKSYGYNPFIVEKKDIEQLTNHVYKKGTSFYDFSEKRHRHMPRALLGTENYLTFLAEFYGGSSPKSSGKQSTKSANISNEYYDNIELRDNFSFRLTTQDRFYNFLYFPVSVLKKLFYQQERRDFFDKWINDQIDNIIVYIGANEENKILFKDVNTLDIKKNGSVLINNGPKLHTAIAGKEIKKEIKTYTLQNIVIDHVTPFESVLFELREQLPALQNIHNVLLKINNNKSISNRSELAPVGNHLISNENFSSQEIADLADDLNRLSSKIQLQLMDKYQNLYKRNKS